MDKASPHLVIPDGAKLLALRHQLAWTQEDAAQHTGYSDRLIRKAENGQALRPRTLMDIVQCYLRHLNITDTKWMSFQTAPVEDSAFTEDSIAENQDSNDVAMLRAKQDILTYLEMVYQERNLDWVHTFVDPQVRFTSDGVTRTGVDAIEQRAQTLLHAFDPIRIDIEQVYTQDDTVIVNFVAYMTHVGEFFGIAPTGKEVSVRNCSIVKVENRKCVEVSDQTDLSHLMHQLRGEEPPVL